MNKNYFKKGPIFVSGVDGDKGIAIVQQLLQLPNQYRHLSGLPIRAGVSDTLAQNVQHLENMGAETVLFDVINNPINAVDAISGCAKLCLLIDPLSKHIKRSNAFQYGKT
jgi:hypothetical protein